MLSVMGWNANQTIRNLYICLCLLSIVSRFTPDSWSFHDSKLSCSIRSNNNNWNRTLVHFASTNNNRVLVMNTVSQSSINLVNLADRTRAALTTPRRHASFEFWRNPTILADANKAIESNKSNQSKSQNRWRSTTLTLI